MNSHFFAFARKRNFSGQRFTALNNSYEMMNIIFRMTGVLLSVLGEFQRSAIVLQKNRQEVHFNEQMIHYMPGNESDLVNFFFC